MHRLLGVAARLAEAFRHHAGNPLPIDLLVVDEASMLDLALATKLLEAVPTAARIILLGDKDQLAAVESGAVFSELSADPTLEQRVRRSAFRRHRHSRRAHRVRGADQADAASPTASSG